MYRYRKPHFQDPRIIRGYAILAKGDTPERLETRFGKSRPSLETETVWFLGLQLAGIVTAQTIFSETLNVSN